MAIQKSVPSVMHPGIVGVRIRKDSDLEAESCDPYAMGWDAGEDLDEPPPCPFKNGLSAKLWRQGFSARVDEYIGRVKSAGGLKASLTGSF